MTRGLGGHSPANVAYYLKGIDFPASEEDLLDHAEDMGAEDAVLDELACMPRGEYYSMADVMHGYGMRHEGRGRSRSGGREEGYGERDDYRSQGRSGYRDEYEEDYEEPRRYASGGRYGRRGGY